MRLFLSVFILTTLAACSQKPVTPTSAAATPTPPKVPAGAYTLDKAHANLTFHVNHLGFSRYTAQLKNFDAQLQFDPANFKASSVTATIDPRSLDLNTPPAGFLDQLLGDQWLNAAQFPEMSFKSTQVEAIGANSMRITGDLTLHGVTKPITLDATFNGGWEGFSMDPHARVGFSAQGTLKRSDFGISSGIPQPGSNLGVSDAVQFEIEAEFSGPPWHGDAASPK